MCLGNPGRFTPRLNFIEMFYNPQRCRRYAGSVSRVELGTQNFNRRQSV